MTTYSKRGALLKSSAWIGFFASEGLFRLSSSRPRALLLAKHPHLTHREEKNLRVTPSDSLREASAIR